MDQPRQQHAILVFPVDPAIDQVACEVCGQARHQLVEVRYLARLRSAQDIVQRQHLKHQGALILRLAQAVQRIERLGIEQCARYHHAAVTDAMLGQLPGQRRLGVYHFEQYIDQ